MCVHVCAYMCAQLKNMGSDGEMQINIIIII